VSDVSSMKYEYRHFDLLNEVANVTMLCSEVSSARTQLDLLEQLTSTTPDGTAGKSMFTHSYKISFSCLIQMTCTATKKGFIRPREWYTPRTPSALYYPRATVGAGQW
jgi:hypothetical protein